jgi:CheY-like chemotaxis protein
MAIILVIDDQKLIRSLLRAALEGDGHEVLEASNGRLGLARYRERAADLIITDLRMPEMNGFELMVAQNRRFPNVKVIAMSGGRESTGPLHAAKLLGARQTFQSFLL